MILKKQDILEKEEEIKVGGEKQKLVPNEIGEIVNKFIKVALSYLFLNSNNDKELKGFLDDKIGFSYLGYQHKLDELSIDSSFLQLAKATIAPNATTDILLKVFIFIYFIINNYSP